MNYLVKVNLLLFLILISTLVTGQNNPRYIKPGEVREVKAVNDTLWILTDTQVDSAIVKAERLKICSEILKLERKKISIKDSIIVEKDSIINICKSGSEHWHGKWLETDKALEQKEIAFEKQKNRTKKTGIISGGLGFVLGIVICILL